MNCQQVQFRLSTWENEPHSERERRKVESHVDRCRDCAAYRAKVRSLDAQALAWRDAQPNRALRLRVESAVSARRARRTPRRLVPALGLAAALALAAIVSLRGDRAYGAMARIGAAMHRVSSAHVLIRWRSDDGAGDIKPIEEIWYRDGKWRKRSDAGRGGDRIVLSEGGGMRFYRFDPARGEVIAANEMASQPTDFSLAALAPSLLPEGVEAQVRDRGQADGEGRSAEVVEVSLPDGSERVVLWLSPGTDLPYHVEKQIREGEGWRTNGTIDLEFDRPVSDSLFDPHSLDPHSLDPGAKAPQSRS